MINNVQFLLDFVKWIFGKRVTFSVQKGQVSVKNMKKSHRTFLPRALDIISDVLPKLLTLFFSPLDNALFKTF